MASRSLGDLNPIVGAMAEKHIALCEAAGIDLLVICTYRSHEEQDALYEQGRTTTGPIVTNARAGQSMHQYRLAYDCVPLIKGKPVWGTTGTNLTLWKKVGALGKEAGLEWAGDWTTFKEYPHFQFTAGHPLSYFEAGGKI